MVYGIIAGFSGKLNICTFNNICGKLNFVPFKSRNYAYTRPLAGIVKTRLLMTRKQKKKVNIDYGAK
jgi:hypothetical protein